MHADAAISEARARIIWGEPPAAVREFLTAHGIADLVAEAGIKEWMRERNQAIRRIGITSVCLGALLTGTAGSLLYWVATWILPLGAARVYGAGGKGVIAGAVLLGAIAVYGLWKLVKGIVYLVRPHSEHRSIPDMGASDMLE